MIGPEQEPNYAGSITWNASNEDLGDTWFMYIWVSLGKGYLWSSKLRLGDMGLTVKKKAGGLLDLSGDDPPLWLQAERIIEPSMGDQEGKARRQTRDNTFIEGSFK